MRNNPNLYKSITVSVSIVFTIRLILCLVKIAPNALGQSKISSISIVKGA